MLYNTKKLYSYCTNFQEITRAAKGCEVANGCCWQEAGPRVVSAVGLSSLGLSASLSCRKSSSGDLGERLASCKWKKKKKKALSGHLQGCMAFSAWKCLCMPGQVAGGASTPMAVAGGFTSAIGQAVLLSRNHQRNKAEGLTHLPAVLKVPWFLLLHPYGFPSLWAQLQRHHCTRRSPSAPTSCEQNFVGARELRKTISGGIQTCRS